MSATRVLDEDHRSTTTTNDDDSRRLTTSKPPAFLIHFKSFLIHLLHRNVLDWTKWTATSKQRSFDGLARTAVSRLQSIRRHQYQQLKGSGRLGLEAD